MSNKDEPAFPQTIDDMGTLRSVTQGMTLRDYFAAAALTNCGPNYYNDKMETAKHCYEVADAMLAERAKGK